MPSWRYLPDRRSDDDERRDSDHRPGPPPGGQRKRQALTDALAAACRDLGFLIVSGTGIANVIIDDAVRESRKFFALDAAAKREVALPSLHTSAAMSGSVPNRSRNWNRNRRRPICRNYSMSVH